MYKRYFYILFYLCANFLFAQDPPPGFDYNQGFSQGFYFFENITIDGNGKVITIKEDGGAVRVKLGNLGS